MLRLLFYITLFAVTTYGALWLAQHPGDVMIQWQGYEIKMQLGILAGLSLCAAIILMTSVMLLRALLLAPKRLREKQRVRHYEYALSALNHTMTALALGDNREAERQLNKSRHYLKSDQPITRLLGVQLAHATGKEISARDAFDAMLEDSSTRPVALRGKIRELMREGQWVHARDYAEEAFAGRPSDHWVAMVLLDILMREHDWDAAASTINKGLRKKALTRQQAQHYRAMLQIARAQEALSEEAYVNAQQLAEMALKQQPDLLAARLVIAKALEGQGEMKRLLAHLEKSWATQPHPDLAASFLANACDVPPPRIHKRLARLIAKQPEHIESLLLQAQVLLKLAEYESARNTLKTALSVTESPRLFMLFADLETAEHADDKQAAQWLSQALSAPKDFGWHCTHCHSLHEQWQSHCRNCSQFDALTWTRPENERIDEEPISIQADQEQSA